MRCLCCGKEIGPAASEQERLTAWHNSCIRRFFGTDVLPEIDISENTLMQLAEKNSREGFTVPGVQKKISLHLSGSKQAARLTLVDYPSGYILKPQTEEYPALPEAEYLAMQMAEETGIRTAPHALIRMNSGENPVYAYITKRIDRLFPTGKGKKTELLAMEDFCQLEERLTENKYHGSYERCAKVIDRYSLFPGIDKSELFIRIVFSFVIGNSDMHLKNLSLLETAPGSQIYSLSAAYDLLPVNIVLPEDTEQMALTMNGKKQNIRRKDFMVMAEAMELTDTAAGRMISRVLSMNDRYHSLCEESFLPSDLKNSLHALIDERSCRLKSGKGS